jgi:TRAP-type C4-dicarboxylate transport system permease small subunit
MKAIERIFKSLDPLFNALSTIVLAGMVLCIVAQVVLRWFFVSIPWSVEMSQYLFVWMTFIAGYAGARRAQHIGVEMLQNALPTAVRRVMKFLSWGLAAFYYGLVFVYCVSLWPKLMMQNTPMLKIPMAFVYLGMMIGLVMMALYYAFYAVQCLLDKGKEEKK